MPGLLQISVDTALFYFEIALPKMLHMDMREKLKTEAQALFEYLVTKDIRDKWSQGYYYGGSHEPEDIRKFADCRCAQADKDLTIQTTGCDSDFYCWTEDERICYHAFTVWNGGVRQTVSIMTNGMELSTDLLLMMAYPTDVAKKQSTTQPNRTTRTKKKPSKSSKRKSTRKK